MRPVFQEIIFFIEIRGRLIHNFVLIWVTHLKKAKWTKKYRIVLFFCFIQKKINTTNNHQVRIHNCIYMSMWNQNYCHWTSQRETEWDLDLKLDIQWGSWNNSLNWRKVFKYLNFIWETWYLKYKLFDWCLCPWVF